MCPHAISTARLDAWWKREETREPKRKLSMCGCCGAPCPTDREVCRFCEGKPVSA
jgi:hypothetical protein